METQGFGQAGGYGRMSGAGRLYRRMDWIRTREAFDLPPTQPEEGMEYYAGLTVEDLRILARIRKF